jgi:hypothetical protein
MACDIVNLVREECKNINIVQEQQPKRSGSSSACVCQICKSIKKKILIFIGHQW